MKTKNELEAEISEAITYFEIEYMGRGPKEVRTHIVEDLIVVRQGGAYAGRATAQHKRGRGGVDQRYALKA